MATPNSTNNEFLNRQSVEIQVVGDISLTSNFDNIQLIPDNIKFSKFQTLADIPTTQIISPQTSNLLPKINYTLNYDKKDPSFYARWGSLYDRMLESLDFIVNNYPPAIKITTPNRRNNTTVQYMSRTNTSKININGSFISNPNGLLLGVPNVLLSNSIDTSKYLYFNYQKYDLVVNNVKYPILSYNATNGLVPNIEITVKGKPFNIGSGSYIYFIAPSNSYIKEFMYSCDDLSRYMLEERGFIFYGASEDEYGNSYVTNLQFQIPFSDTFNLDFSSSDFFTLRDSLLEYAKNYDDRIGNIIKRRVVPQNIIASTLEEFNTENNNEKVLNMLSVFGRYYDDIDLYIRNLSFLHRFTYDKVNNAPDELYTNVLSLMGFNLPIGINPQLARLILLNAPYLLKAKGTRKAIETVLSLFNIPPSMIDFDEHVYVAQNAVDLNRLNRYYSFIYPNSSFFGTRVDANGYPSIINSEIVFQSSGYFEQFENLLPLDFTGATIIASSVTTTYENIAWQDYDVHTGSTVNYFVSRADGLFENGSCYQYSGNTIVDDLPTVISDECGCELPIVDRAYQLCVQPDELYGLCNNILLDIYYFCQSGGTAVVQYNTFGGYPPYNFIGDQVGDIVNTGDTIAVQVQDSRGCLSELFEMDVFCVDPCANNDLDFSLSYDCITNISGQTGQAVLNISVSGGVAPYTYIGAQNGSIVNDQQVIFVQIVDSTGCRTAFKRIEINCAEQQPSPCGIIQLEVSFETTNVEFDLSSSRANVVFSITGLDFAQYIDTVTLTSVSPPFLNNSPKTTVFTTPFGADTLSFSYPPFIMPNFITGTFDFVIVLTNGCTYTANFSLQASPRVLGSKTFTTLILNP